MRQQPQYAGYQVEQQPPRYGGPPEREEKRDRYEDQEAYQIMKQGSQQSLQAYERDLQT